MLYVETHTVYLHNHLGPCSAIKKYSKGKRDCKCSTLTHAAELFFVTVLYMYVLCVLGKKRACSLEITVPDKVNNTSLTSATKGMKCVRCRIMCMPENERRCSCSCTESGNCKLRKSLASRCDWFPINLISLAFCQRGWETCYDTI